MKTELFMEMEDYESKKMKKLDNGLDITALHNESKDKILLRVITKPKAKSGYVGGDVVDEMVATIKNGDYDKGILISEKFTKAAEKKLAKEGIKIITEHLILDFPSKRLFFIARELVDVLCKTKCGKAPQKETDCNGHSNNQYSCKIRVISDNLSYHFQKDWSFLLKKDIVRLLSMNHSASD
ncbi:MAG: restriction endonuclease [Candidatus Bathyarchaeota archaeon]|nr:MAG: restriction endonuclease [Candidatus Bathyarchaeota archaeon]